MRPGDAAAADDTFSCLSQSSGPEIVLRNDGSYSNYRSPQYPAGTSFDARGAWWRHQVFPKMPQQDGYLIILGSNEAVMGSACWAGGHVVGTSPRNAPWYMLKAGQEGAGMRIHANGMTIDGIRMDNTFGESAIWIAQGANFEIRNAWLSHTVDDCIENDRKENGRIIDSLLDGCHMGLSIDNRNEAARPGNTIIVDRVLLHLREVDMTNRRYDTWGTWVKTTPDSGGEVGLKIYDSLFTFSDRTPEKYTNRIARAWQNLRDCRNNVLAWLPDGDVPSSYPKPPACFRVVTGKAARDLWAAARQNWINCHPRVARVPNDPEANVARCDPHAYGGGEAVTHPLPVPAPVPVPVPDPVPDPLPDPVPVPIPVPTPVPVPTPAPGLTIQATRISTQVVVDGNLQEFSGAAPAALGQHAVRVLWDNEALYVGAHVADAQLIASISARDGNLWTEDAFEVFLDPDRSAGSRMTAGDVQLVVNPLGTRWDGDHLGRLWDAEWASSVSLTGVGFTVELMIPWSVLGITPVVGAAHGFSFVVDDKDATTASHRMWGGATAGFRMPERWGILTLSDALLKQAEE